MKSQFEIFKPYPNLTILFSDKTDGSMKIEAASAENGDEQTQENHRRFFAKHNIKESTVISAGIAHSPKIVLVSKSDAGTVIPQTDGLITNQPNLFLTVTVADCLPIFLFDPVQKAVGIVHAGWRGLSKNIARRAISTFVENFKSRPQDMLVAIGPGVGVCHFEVQQDVLKKFDAFLPDACAFQGGSYFLDLKYITRRQLESAGVTSEHIEVSPLCTFCEKEKCFSFRRDHSNPVQAHLAGTGFRER